MTQRGKAPWSLLALLVSLALVFGACQAQPGGGPTTPIVGDQADPNGELVTNQGSEPDTIDPHRASFVGEIAVIMSVFEGLMTLDPKTLKPVPAVAAKEPEISSDAKTWKFTLRDTKFSDGTPVTAKDFERGFLRTCDPATHGEYSFVLYVIEGCEKWNSMDPKKATPAELSAAKAATAVKALDDKTLEFKLRESAGYFGSIAYMWVGMPVQQKSLDTGGEKWTEPATYIGNGAFKLTEWKHNEKMVLERNEGYWRGAPKLKKWTRVMINEGAVAFAAYRNNELDVFGAAAEDLRTVEADPALKAQMQDVPGSCTFYNGFNTRKAPFDDVKVRQAFARSIDRNAFIADVQKVGAPANGGFIPPGFPGYDASDPEQKFDAAAAKKLLGESKYAGKPEMQNIKFTYSSNARTKTRVEWLQQQWKTNIGIEVVPDPVDSTAYTQLVKKPETLPLMFILGWCADFPHQQNWLTTVFHSESLSRTGWKNAEFDKLTKEADQDTNKEKADQTYQTASRILSKEAPAAWLYYNAGKTLTKPWVKGVTTTAIDAALGQFRMWEIFVTKKG
jgi:oligopeptide transport system substrate-binding protein